MKRLNKKNRVYDVGDDRGVTNNFEREYSLSNEEIEFMLTMRLD